MENLVNIHISYNLVDVLDERDYQRIYDYFHSLFGQDKDASKCTILSIDLHIGQVNCEYESFNFSVDI